MCWCSSKYWLQFEGRFIPLKRVLHQFLSLHQWALRRKGYTEPWRNHDAQLLPTEVCSTTSVDPHSKPNCSRLFSNWSFTATSGIFFVVALLLCWPASRLPDHTTKTTHSPGSHINQFSIVSGTCLWPCRFKETFRPLFVFQHFSSFHKNNSCGQWFLCFFVMILEVRRWWILHMMRHCADLCSCQGGKLTFPVKIEALENTVQHKTVDLVQIQLEQVTSKSHSSFLCYESTTFPSRSGSDFQFWCRFWSGSYCTYTVNMGYILKKYLLKSLCIWYLAA